MGLRIVVFGQAPFGREITEGLERAGHSVAGVYAPPDRGRPDPLAQLAEERGWRLFRYPRFRRKGKAIAEIVEEYRSLGAELNVLPFTTVILPPEIIDAPEHGSLCFHPSLLPAHRGGAALAWQIILGARETGVTVFKVDEGVDEGPIVVQRGGVEIGSTDTAASLYFEKLYPMGVEAMLEAVQAVAEGRVEPRPQPEEGVSFQGLVTDEVARIDWSRRAGEIDRLIRGCDPQPGAFAEIEGGPEIRLFDSRFVADESDARPGSALGFEAGRLLLAARGGKLSVGKLRVGAGKKMPASECGLAADARLC
jgi:formyltetrahydrofolate dehydrogenase